MRGPHSPEDFEKDWLQKDIPQLAIHVISFKDATIITVTVLHTLTDFLGLMAFYKAWLLTLHGRQDEIPPYIGYLDKDPLEGLQSQPQSQQPGQGQDDKPPPPPEKYVYTNQEVGRFGYIKFILRHMWDCYWYPDASLRFLTLPQKFVEGLSASARAELIAASHKTGRTTTKAGPAGDSDCFVSDSDVLCAWWTRMLVKNQSPTSQTPSSSPSQTVCLTNRFDSRDVLAKMGLLPSANISFFGNAAYNASFFASADEFADEGERLGLLAKKVRESIKLHRSEEQLRAQDAAFRDSVARTGHLPLYGDADMMVCVFTNCYKGRLYQMDFGPALVKTKKGGEGEVEEEEKKKKKALPVFINCTGKENRWSTRNATAILGRSEGGDWWMSSRLRDDVWKRIEGEFAQM